MIRRFALFILSLLFIVALVCIHDNFPIMKNNYRRDVYSVIVFNNTDTNVSNISILVGKDANDVETITEVANIEKIAPNEYRKINIDTSNPSPELKLPYNVFVKLNGKSIIETAGYFGIKTGGMALIYVNDSSDGAVLQRVFEHDKRYKRVYKKDLKNQELMSWYE